MTDIFQLFEKISKKSEVSSQKPTHLVAGLGNPGDQYRYTRHNAGFLAMDYLSQKQDFTLKKLQFQSLCHTAQMQEKTVLFIKPQTFMNLSGDAIRAAAHFYEIPTENMLILFDDISLAPGKIRLRKKGSHGGHNGIRSIIDQLGTDEFARVKIGVGEKPHPEMDLADWVLSKFTQAEQEQVFESLTHVYESVEMWLSGRMEDAMGKYNRRG